MLQRELFSRGPGLKVARSTWVDKTKEEPVVQQILDGLRVHGIAAWRVKERISRCWKCKQFIGRPSTSGIPDIIGWIPRRVASVDGLVQIVPIPVYIEVKRPVGGVKRAAQIAFIEQARAAGCVACFARGWDDVARELLAHGFRAAA